MIQLKDNLRVIPNFPKKGIMLEICLSTVLGRCYQYSVDLSYSIITKNTV